ncbi:trafficking protein particle complex subunit 6B [Neurospora hispaniola]|uniref:Trafficking protein particle complex subunit 6B n=1 Tax=Neurospora hispaniola TaxID=588809 RepID=A0AAJ0IA42_9PEZI|nr:trafficking protein particle complex subunit 6B [Neurospora hispaniola]
MSFDTILPPYNASDPTARFLASSCLDFLLIELVPMAYRITNQLDSSSAEPSASSAGDDAQSTATGPAPGGPQRNSVLSSRTGGLSAGGAGGAGMLGAGLVGGGGGGGGGSVTGSVSAKKMDEDEERDAVFARLEGLGYRVGQGLVERFSRDRPRFNDTLDVIKFLCKDLWTLVFRKQVDNLKTNHRGVYVLTDNSFRPLSRMSAETSSQAIARAQPFLWFPCGVVRGALAAMGITATVTAESSELPAAVFQIKTVKTQN